MAKSSFITSNMLQSPDKIAETIIHDRGVNKELAEFLLSTSHQYRAIVYGLIYINDPVLLDPVLAVVNSLLGNHYDFIESSKL